MAEQGFIFTSPGVKFKERDLSFVTRNVGITTLGLVAETLKGPAFEPIFVQDKGIYRDRFGGQSVERFPNGELRYQGPYAANAYLDESSQLYVTRVLGLSGYEAGTAWAITISAGVDLSTTGSTVTASTTGISFTNFTYLGEIISQNGQTGTIFSGFTKVSPTTFSGIKIDYTVTSLAGNGSGTLNQVATTITGSSYAEYENMVVALLRARGNVEDIEDAAPVTTFDANILQIIANDTDEGVGDLFGQFTIKAINTLVTGATSADTYVVSLNENSRDYLPNVIGSKPKDKNTKIFVEAVYPDLIKKLDADGLAYAVNSTLINATTDAFTNYKQGYTTPVTPWVVSELRGNKVERLFKFISISDGNSANSEIKISIQNINPVTKEFDIIIRDFNDTDANINVLESFQRCTMRKSESGYVGNRIGTANGDYDLRSDYVMLEIDDQAPEDAFTCGFEGYYEFDYAISATSSSVAGVSPKIFFKQFYAPDDRLNRTYLGVSETAYNGVSLKGTGINQNLFNYQGAVVADGEAAKSKGFHMDSNATGVYYDGLAFVGEFEVGAARFQGASDINSASNPYSVAAARKFTLVPAGGFDGWDENRDGRTNTDAYRKGGFADGVPDGDEPTNDFQAWAAAINTYANPESITINLFVTPGINFSDNSVLVTDTIEMIEQERADTLYIIDCPDIDIQQSTSGKQDVVAANEIVDLLDIVGIDSNYSCTYFPWIKIKDDDNNVSLYIPPTGQVAKAMAYTDNVKFPWFSPAGLQRGIIDARRAKYKLSLDARDVLYSGRINPIADFTDVGTTIFGQKTLQVQESALDRINVRRLLLQLKVLIANVAIRLVFEQNDQTTIDEFLSKVNPILDTIKRERGLQEFRVKMDDSINTPETKDRNELYGEIMIKPTRAVEFIGITFTITPSGANFDEA
ncbi:MAG: hypothetical protein HC836_35860 [Richelia sp. RM2_1_2]|nr:hypothetical protein [Richelia sp. RM2_1_2]